MISIYSEFYLLDEPILSFLPAIQQFIGFGGFVIGAVAFYYVIRFSCFDKINEYKKSISKNELDANGYESGQKNVISQMGYFLRFIFYLSIFVIFLIIFAYLDAILERSG